MTRSKQLTIDSTFRESEPNWLGRLSGVLEDLDPAYAWRFFKGWRLAGMVAGDRSKREVEVVYCDDPRIVVTVKRGVWSLVCTFEPPKRESKAREVRQVQANRKRRQQ